MPTLDSGKISLFFRDLGTGGPPILLLHELGGNSASWQQVTHNWRRSAGSSPWISAAPGGRRNRSGHSN